MKKYKAAFKKMMWDTVENYNDLSYEETELIYQIKHKHQNEPQLREKLLKTQGSMSALNGCLIRMAAVLGGTPIYKSVKHPAGVKDEEFISYTVVTGIAITKER